ncbi:hypothetical protein [Vibrio phage vB_VhaP_VH-5]|uniref:Uncharacterized protein n=1 Tax=Vibrio phage vB_VhaP_VH-5 TaxID=2660694 RepID=A0A5Q2W9Y4_9CAUD|nr:hypothetical protein [Vibrio phage vB_VhaP_VH-5]
MCEVTGNFEKALQKLIHSINDGSPEHTRILNQWDRDRGNSWFTRTGYFDAKGELHELQD